RSYCFCPPYCSQRSPSPKMQTRSPVQAMKEWKVPGVAIAVMQDSKVIHAKATAIATSKTDFPSPPRRFFPSARSPNRSRLSPSPFSRTKEEWNRDKPVRSYLPEFQMNDPVASEQATPRDLFS